MTQDMGLSVNGGFSKLNYPETVSHAIMGHDNSPGKQFNSDCKMGHRGTEYTNSYVSMSHSLHIVPCFQAHY